MKMAIHHLCNCGVLGAFSYWTAFWDFGVVWSRFLRLVTKYGSYGLLFFLPQTTKKKANMKTARNFLSFLVCKDGCSQKKMATSNAFARFEIKINMVLHLRGCRLWRDWKPWHANREQKILRWCYAMLVGENCSGPKSMLTARMLPP